MRPTLLMLLDENPSMDCFLQLNWASVLSYQGDMQIHVTSCQMALNPFPQELESHIGYEFVPFTVEHYQTVSCTWANLCKSVNETLLPREEYLFIVTA